MNIETAPYRKTVEDAEADLGYMLPRNALGDLLLDNHLDLSLGDSRLIVAAVFPCTCLSGRVCARCKVARRDRIATLLEENDDMYADSICNER